MKPSRVYLKEQVIANLILNYIISYGLSSLTLSKLVVIPLTAPVDDPFHPNMAGDLIVGTVITGLAVTLIVGIITGLLIKKGKLSTSGIQSSWMIDKLPNSLFTRGLFIGVIASVTFAIPVSISLHYLGVAEFNVSTYIAWHSVYCGFIGAGISYFVCAKDLILNQ